MLEQYRAIKRTLPPETILFFRLGDFYEMFFEDAVRASDLLDITLTGREGGAAGRVPMCGVPYHAFQGYVKVLLEHRLKVAICEQIGDPRASRGLLERKVTRIITPATHLDDETKPAASEYMAAVAGANEAYGLAYLDLGTGEFCVRELSQERLLPELLLLQPKEIILPKSIAGSASLVATLKDTARASVTIYEDWIFDAPEALARLREAFKLTTDRSLSCSERPLATSAAGAILYYLRDHLHTALEHVRLPRLIENNQTMTLDRQTQRSLELLAGQDGNKTSSLLSCLDQTRTAMGGRMLHQWLTHPLLSAQEIRHRQDAVADFLAHPDRLQTFRAQLEGVKDLERTLSRLNYGVANARDVLNLKLFLERIPQMAELFAASQSQQVRELVGSLKPLPQLQNLIEEAIVAEPPMGLKDGGLIKNSFDAGLDELRALAKGGREWLVDFQQREIERTGIKSLRIKYSHVFGYAIEVTTANLPLVGPDYIRKQTLANAERFITPELREWDDKISSAQERIKNLEYELFQQIRSRILEELRVLQDMARAVGTLDVLQALAVVAAGQRWTRPEILESTELTIEGGRHPIVERMLPLGQFVENDAYLDTDNQQLVILTGPNMAGKSTYIRQIGLIVLLAQMGSFVPARSARIGLVDRIFTRIGASDNLAAGESTFMVEMIETAHILHQATHRSLLILDEVGRGTSTFDGVSIAWAICEQLIQGPAKPRTLFATHYHELTQLEGRLDRVKNYAITVRETSEGIIFLRKVARGASDRSYGIHVAKLAGIPQAVTARADEILRVLENEHAQATRRLSHEAKAPALSEPTAERPTHPILEELKAVDLDRLTPMEALMRLAQWKRSLP